RFKAGARTARVRKQGARPFQRGRRSFTLRRRGTGGAMKLLVIDNYDSFTYNLVHFLGELGADSKVWRNDKISLDEIAAMAPEGIVLSPGPGTPQQAGICLALIDRFKATTPILGVCLGHQAIGEALGGDVIRAPQLMHGKTSKINHTGKGL